MSAPTDKFITVGEVETHVQISGQGEPLLFLHGFGTANLWLPIYQKLASKYTVYVPDHPGFGRSGMPDWFDSMDDMVLHYADLLKALNLPRVKLVGFSLGGWIAAEFASFFPERIDGLALIAAAGLRVSGAPIVDLFAHDPQSLAQLCFDDLRNAMILMGDMSDPLKLFLQDYQERTMLARLAWNPGYSPKLARRLSRVQAPALIIWGDNDQLIPSAHAQAYHAAIPGSEVQLLANCNHMPVIERADETAQLIHNFFAKESR